MEPQITQIKNGWAAVGDGWAVFGRSPEEARVRFADAERQHAIIRSRETPSEPPQPSGQFRPDAQG